MHEGRRLVSRSPSLPRSIAALCAPALLLLPLSLSVAGCGSGDLVVVQSCSDDTDCPGESTCVQRRCTLEQGVVEQPGDGNGGGATDPDEPTGPGGSGDPDDPGGSDDLCHATAATEDCTTPADDDCDGLTGCADPDCASHPECTGCVAYTDQEVCSNGMDDDCDGAADCEDPECVDAAACCVPSTERCGNGLDDDCDGALDCDDPDCGGSASCAPVCEETSTCENDDSKGNCNGHLGDDFEACMAAGNPGGCSYDWLVAWCSRRVDPEPTRWDTMVQDWVISRCEGEVRMRLKNGTYPVYYCVDSYGCETHSCTTPLVVLFDGSASVAVREDDGRSRFDLSGDGLPDRTDWPEAKTPWLALDRDGDGRITSGAELFGSATPLPAGPAQDGFEALAELDADGNALIDARDPGWSRLLLWRDRDGDRRSSPAELTSVARAGLLRIALEHRVVPECDARGNCQMERGTMVWRDADGRERLGAVVDLHLARRDSAPETALACSE